MPHDLSTENLLNILMRSSGGPWTCHYGDDSVKCDCPYILGDHGGEGSIATVEVDNGLRISEGGNDAPPEEQAKHNAQLLAMSRSLLIEVLRLRGEDVPEEVE